jgi:DNA mismatch repair protein MutL
MANRIRILDEKVINRIAAGEVVERPVSVVKELLENSIDAQATSIRIDIENGGKKLVRVQDNGVGMSHDDAFHALERQATSKLTSEKDLVGIATMGFRGEALASIASVSRLKLVTREDSDPAGTVIAVEGGILRGSEQIGMGVGTIVEVRNLFFNVPVRRKFLKGSETESGHIRELVTKFALAFPAVGFAYTEDGKVKMDAPSVSSTFERIYALYSRDVRENLIEVHHETRAGTLRGYVGRPPYARSNLRSVLTFVNGRSVKDRVVNSAVTRAFSNLMERGRYPLAILFVDLPPEEVDVNVHPQKAEVRFVRSQEVFDLLVDGVHTALTGAPFRPPHGLLEPILPRPPSTPVLRHLKEDKPAQDPEPSSGADTSAIIPGTAQAGPEARTTDLVPERTQPLSLAGHGGRYSTLGIVGKLPGSFLVLHDDQDLIVMDHHAAHERLLFDDLLRADRAGERLESQDLLIPRILSYSPVEARALASHLDLLHAAGFRIEEFGENDFAVKGVPTWFNDQDPETLLDSLIEVMLDTGLRGDPSRKREELLKTIACRAAVKESTAMQIEEMRALLHQLDRSGSPQVCPHGRPLTVRMPFSEIRKRMGRKS